VNVSRGRLTSRVTLYPGLLLFFTLCACDSVEIPVVNGDVMRLKFIKIGRQNLAVVDRPSSGLHVS
jgi:hypothetical protein